MPGIHSVRLILPGGILHDAFVAFEGGTITRFGQGSHPEATTNGEGRLLAPGFIDLHVHGGNGSDFLDATPEAFAAAARFHLEGGTTTLCPTLATATYDQYARVIEARRKVQSRVRLMPLHLEGPHLALSKAGAHAPELLHSPTEDEIAWIERHSESLSQITIAPELHNALRLIERASKGGVRISIGHSDATPEQAAAAVAAGAMKATHLFNAMGTSEKRGLFRHAGLAEYSLTEDRLVCEVIGDGFHVPASMVEIAYRCKGPDRMVLVSDALAGAGCPVGTAFSLGRLACVVADGYCQLADGSALSGSASRLLNQLRFVTRRAGIPLVQAVEMVTRTPARVLNMAGQIGEIATGAAADLVELTDDLEAQRVWVAGEPVFEA